MCEEAGGLSSWVGDGYCDDSNNIEECSYDMGDCCPTDCDELVAAGCPDNADGCYSEISCGDCSLCVDASSQDLAVGGSCGDSDPETGVSYFIMVWLWFYIVASGCV